MTRSKLNETTWPVKGIFICEARSGLAFLFRATDISGFKPPEEAFGKKKVNEVWFPFSQMVKLTRHDKITDPEGTDVTVMKEWILDKNIPGFKEWREAQGAPAQEIPEDYPQDTFDKFMNSEPEDE